MKILNQVNYALLNIFKIVFIRLQKYNKQCEIILLYHLHVLHYEHHLQTT